MRRWLVVLSLLGVVAVWAVRLAVELSQPPEESQAGLAPDWPWWSMSRALEEEGLVPPPV